MANLLHRCVHNETRKERAHGGQRASREERGRGGGGGGGEGGGVDGEGEGPGVRSGEHQTLHHLANHQGLPPVTRLYELRSVLLEKEAVLVSHTKVNDVAVVFYTPHHTREYLH